MNTRIWIVPRNDLEAVEIIRLLEQHGELLVISRQAWGASWENLEPEVVSGVEDLLAQHPDAEVVGVELAGTPPWGGRNIDHHQYTDGDRSSEKSSIEQVAEILGHELNRYERLVAENDKGWIPALLAAGASQGEVDTIRLADRCAQGVTPDDEAQAVRDIAGAEWRGRKVFIRCPRGVTSALTDRLYGQFDEALTAAPDKWIYYGPRARDIHVHVHAGGLGHARDWAGGRRESGYAGFIAPTPEAKKVIETFFWWA